MSEDKTEPKPVTFKDHGYNRRTIKVGKDELRVEHGRVTATDPKHVTALEKLYGMERVNA